MPVGAILRTSPTVTVTLDARHRQPTSAQRL